MVSKAALTLLDIENEDGIVSALAQTMEMLGRALEADRVHLSRCAFTKEGVSFVLISKWHSVFGHNNPLMDLNKPFPLEKLGDIQTLFTNGTSYNGPVKRLPLAVQQFINPYGTIKSIVILPLFFNGNAWGVITIDDCHREHILPDEEMNIVRTIGLMFASVFSRFFHKEQAVTDPLTGVRNRRYFMETTQRQLQTAITENRAYALILADIDHFKQVNDRYGHIVGDEVLKIFSARLKHALKKDTLLARYGGEEFIITLPDADAERALKTATRLKNKISNELFRIDDLEIKVTASFGIACKTDNGTTLKQLMQSADKALYRAKAAGRDAVAVYTHGE